MSLPTTRRGFSLIELVIVVVIIGIIAAIAIPRMSRGAAGASDASLRSSLSTVRNALDLFYTEHQNQYPPVATFSDYMLQYSDDTITTAPGAKSSTLIYGPYLRTIPALPVGAKKGKSGVAAATGANIGWLYNETTGAFTANTTTEADAAGVLYNTY
jgi:prepilin-type N-terminal cleavage/methylation domain-containing protein